MCAEQSIALCQVIIYKLLHSLSLNYCIPQTGFKLVLLQSSPMCNLLGCLTVHEICTLIFSMIIYVLLLTVSVVKQYLLCSHRGDVCTYISF